ncbi:MAG: right-handed parallel beta-helix repeat-containing protein [Candidatus Hodarchaeales archaeon]|jgi:parallel beta-helix repeat protein
MNKRMSSNFCIFIFLLLGISVHSLINQQSNIIHNQLISNSKGNLIIRSLSLKKKFIENNPISIENNTDFMTQAKVKGWSGNGSQETPYIIQGLNIHSSGVLIKIENTDLFFIIRSNMLQGQVIEPIWAIEGAGIVLRNVANGFIDNNTIWNAAAGIFLRYSSNNTISNNVIKNNEYGGIRVESSFNTTISSNLIYDNGKSDQFSSSICGIFLKISSENSIFNNTIHNNNQYGINLYLSSNNSITKNNIGSHRFAAIDMVSDVMIPISQYTYDSSYNNIISKNILFGNKWGIGIRGCDNVISDNIIFNNNIGLYLGLYNFEMPQVGTIVTLKASKITVSGNFISNSSSGIVLANSEEITLLNNTIFNCTNYGIKIPHPSSNNLVSMNDFISNNIAGTSQAFDNGSSNNFLKNYWYEWVTPDSDSNNIVDNPYFIAGDSDNTDPSPLVHPTNPNSPTNITAPTSKSSPAWTFIITLIAYFFIFTLKSGENNDPR